MLGEGARQPIRLLDEPRQPAPAPGGAGGVARRRRQANICSPLVRSRLLRADCDVVLDVRSEALRAAGRALDLAGRQSEHLAELADRPSRAEGGEGRYQGSVGAPEALV